MQVGGAAKSGQNEGGRGRRNRMIGQMVTEIVSEAKAGHFAGLVTVILPLLDGRSSHRNGTTGDPNESPHPVVNRTLHRCMHAYMRISCRAGRASLAQTETERHD